MDWERVRGEERNWRGREESRKGNVKSEMEVAESKIRIYRETDKTERGKSC